MTYCVGLCMQDGLVMLSDTRTNAGVDNISIFSKMFTAVEPGERMLCVLTSGNLAITQSAWNRLQEGIPFEGAKHTLFTVPSMFQAARLVGEAIRQVYRDDNPMLSAQNIGFSVSMLVGGQILGGPMRLFMIYSAGNFIESTSDTPFLQIGELKYGKPILDRALTFTTSVEDGIKLALISMDSTLRSNLTVGLPLDLLVCREGTQRIALQRRIGDEDPYLRLVRDGWSAALHEAWVAMPPAPWACS